MNTADLTKEELQIFVLHVRAKKTLAKELGMSTEDTDKFLKENDLKTPTSALHSSSREELKEMVARYSSTKKAAQALGVSSSTLASRLRKPYLPYQEILVKMSKEEAELQLKKFKTAALMAKILNSRYPEHRPLTREILARHLKSLGIDLLENTAAVSDKHTARGRRAEQVFMALRGATIVEDMNVKDNHAPYDVKDTELGRVQIRSASQYTRKNTGLATWNFSIAGTEEADHFALIAYGADRTKPMGYALLKTPLVNGFHSRNKTSITLVSENLILWPEVKV